MNYSQSWFTRPEITSIIESSEVDGKICFHLQAPAQFRFSEAVITTLKEQYDPKFEKGGFFLGSPTQTQEGYSILIDEVIFISNIHPTPEVAYRYDNTLLNNSLYSAFAKGQIPLLFHTHPTIGKDFISEQYNFIHQLNTSLQDQNASSSSYKVEAKDLYLPCVLVVGDGSSINNLFIGFYNGLIAPKKFSEHHEELRKETVESLISTSKKILEKDENKLLVGIGLLLLIIMCVRYPKTSFAIALGLAVILPTLAIANQDRNLYFGITHGEELVIEIPSPL